MPFTPDTFIDADDPFHPPAGAIPADATALNKMGRGIQVAQETAEDALAAALAASGGALPVGRQYVAGQGIFAEGYHIDATPDMGACVSVRVLMVPIYGANALVQPVSMWDGAAGHRVWQTRWNTDDTLGLQWSIDGTNGTGNIVTHTGPLLSDYISAANRLAPIWLRWDFVPNDGAGHSVVYYSYAYNGGVWTVMGNAGGYTQPTVGPGFHQANVPVYVMDRQPGNATTGLSPMLPGSRIYAAEVYTGPNLAGLTPALYLDVRKAGAPPAPIPDGITPSNHWSPESSALLAPDEENWQGFRAGTLLPDALMGGSPGQVMTTKVDGTVGWLDLGAEWNLIRDGGADPNVADFDQVIGGQTLTEIVQARLDAGYSVTIPPLPGAAGWQFMPGAAQGLAWLTVGASGAALRGVPKATYLVPKAQPDGTYHGDVIHVSQGLSAVTGLVLDASLGGVARANHTLAAPLVLGPADTNFTVTVTDDLDANTIPAAGVTAIKSNKANPGNESCVFSYTHRDQHNFYGCAWVRPPLATRTFPALTNTLTLCASDGAMLRLIDNCLRFWIDELWCDGWWWDGFVIGDDRYDNDWTVSTTAGSNIVHRVSGPLFTTVPGFEGSSVGAIDAIGLGVFGTSEQGPTVVHVIDQDTISLWTAYASTPLPAPPDLTSPASIVASTQSSCRMHKAGTAISNGGPGGASFFDMGNMEARTFVNRGFVTCDDVDHADLMNSGVDNLKLDSAWGNIGVKLGGAGGWRTARGKVHSTNIGWWVSNRVPNNPPQPAGGPGTGNFGFGEYEVEDYGQYAFAFGIDSLSMHHGIYMGHMHTLGSWLTEACMHIDNHVNSMNIGVWDCNIIRNDQNVAAVIQFNTPQALALTFDQIDIRGSSKYDALIRCKNGQIPSGVIMGPDIALYPLNLQFSQAQISSWVKLYAAGGGPLADLPTNPVSGALPPGTRMGQMWRFLPPYKIGPLAFPSTALGYVLRVPKGTGGRVRLAFAGSVNGQGVFCERISSIRRGPNATDAPVETAISSFTDGPNAPVISWGLTNDGAIGYAQAQVASAAAPTDGTLYISVEFGTLLGLDVPQANSSAVLAV